MIDIRAGVRSIGVKSVAAVVLAGGAIAIAITSGSLRSEHLAHLSTGSSFAIGLFASVGAALLPALFVDTPVRGRRELPPLVIRMLFIVAFACIGAGTFSNEATARIAGVPAALTEPSRSEYCPKPGAKAAEPDAAEDDEPPPPPPVDESGCALVKRAYQLGYTKSLGSCAPKAAVVVEKKKAAAKIEEVCERRQRDEPFAHFAWRRVVDTASGTSPADAVGDRVDGFRTRLDYLEDLLADVGHSVTGTPHASHHLWVNLPDPHPSSWRQHFTGHEPCASRFADLPLWPRWTDASAPGLLVEHVLGQLLFATRFGTTASCSDYTIHWNAPLDACSRLAANPAGFLDGAGALEPLRGVLDRRKRQQALRAMAKDLGHEPTMPEPPPARAVVSVACFIVDPAATGATTGREITLDGEVIALREVRVAAIRTTGAGPIDVYSKLALLLGGVSYTGPASDAGARIGAEPPDDLRDASSLLLGLEPLVDADPFLGARAPLERADVVEVYPFERHLKGFVDAFRRAYLPQRGRL